MDDTFLLLHEEATVALRDALKARPALMAAVDAATRQAHEAAQQFERFCLRVGRGTRHGEDELVPALARLLDQVQCRRAYTGEAAIEKSRLAD